MAKYSNLRAMRALVIASLQGIFKSPSAVFFAFAFPLVFILVFGTMGNGSGSFHILVAPTPGSDTNNMLYYVLSNKVSVLKWVKDDSATINKKLREGDIVATIDIHPATIDEKPEYKVTLHAASTEMDKAAQLGKIIEDVALEMDPAVQRRKALAVAVDIKESKVREYKSIDFILPGQLAFSLLASAVFGTAFVFFNLRQTLVLKRFFATPVRKEIIVISEGIARMIFQLLSVVVIIAVGYYAFGFTLYKGWLTFLDIFIVSAISIMIFMGLGFIVSGLAKSDASIPIFSNLIVMPQMLLAGVFFSIDNFPGWMQPFCRALPLSYLNDALRKISFDGAALWTVRMDIVAILIWGVIIYGVAIKTFKWE